MKNQLKLKFKKELIKKVEVTKQELTNLKNNTRKKQKNKDYYYKNMFEWKLDKGYWTKVEKKQDEKIKIY